MISLDRLGGDKPIENPLAFATGLEALSTMAAVLAGADDEDAVYAILADHLPRVVPLDRVSVGLLSADGSRFTVRALYGELGFCPPGTTIEANEGSLQAAARARRYIHAPPSTPPTWPTSSCSERPAWAVPP